MDERILTVKRVAYGKNSTPVQNRNYRLDCPSNRIFRFFCISGNMRTWKEFAKKRGYMAVTFMEKGGTSKEELV